MTGRRTAWLLPLALLVAACSDDRPASAPTTSAAETSTTSTAPPLVLGVARALELQVGQCYASLPEPVEDPEATTTTTAHASTTTTTMASLAVADCAGTHRAQVYATFCLVALDGGALDAGPCPGPAEDPWPGDREVRRAAVRACLARFEEAFGEPYATSSRTSEELTPTEGAWQAGDHRVVCAAGPA